MEAVERRSPAPLPAGPGRAWWLAQGGIFAVTVAMRFYRLADLPLGMHYDEAFNGLDVTAVLRLPLYRWPVFLTGNFGREPLHIYLMAAAQSLFGPGPFALRSVSAACAVLLGPALAWLAWELAPSLGCPRRRLSLWAAAVPLTLLWCQVLSRYATRNLPLALLATLAWASLWRAASGGKWRWWLAGGALAGLCLYTYLPARLLPLVLLPMGALASRRQWVHLRARADRVVGAAAMAALVAMPLALYYLRYPEWLFVRTSQVSALGASWPEAVARNVLAVAGMAFVRGDVNVRNNLPGRPVFDALMAAAFAVGIVWLLARPRRSGAAFVLSWLVVMLLPTALSGDAPHFLRAVGALPAFALVAAIGLEVAVAWVARQRPSLGRAAVAAGWLALAASVAITWRVFAREWAPDEALYYARDAGLYAVGLALRDEAAADATAVPAYLSPSAWDHPTVQYALVGAATPVVLGGFDGRVCVRVAPGQARYAFLAREDERGPALLRTYLPDAGETTLVTGPDGGPLAVQMEQPAGGRVVFPEMTAAAVPFADGIGLEGYWLSASPLQPGGPLYVRLWWQASAVPSERYTAFAHLLAAGDDGSLRQVAGADAEPGKGSCATDGWQVGETIVDEMEIAVPADLAPGRQYWLAIGLYTPADGRRLAVPGHTDDQVLIGPLAVADPSESPAG